MTKQGFKNPVFVLKYINMRNIVFEPGIVCHVFNRGVDKRNIFISEADMWRFIQGMFLFNDKDISLGILRQIEIKNKGRINFTLLKEFIDKNKTNREPLVRIMGDCLMPNHFHLMVQEIEKGGLSKFMHRLGTGYTNYFNKKYSRTGSLFEGPFKAAKIDNDEYLKYVLVYMNIINPGQLVEPELKEKGIENIEKVLNFAENYSFCTNPDYLGKRESIIIDKGLLGKVFDNPKEYQKFAKDILLSKKYSLASNFFLE